MKHNREMAGGAGSGEEHEGSSAYHASSRSKLDGGHVGGEQHGEDQAAHSSEANQASQFLNQYSSSLQRRRADSRPQLQRRLEDVSN